MPFPALDCITCAFCDAVATAFGTLTDNESAYHYLHDMCLFVMQWAQLLAHGQTMRAQITVCELAVCTSAAFSSVCTLWGAC